MRTLIVFAPHILYYIVMFKRAGTKRDLLYSFFSDLIYSFQFTDNLIFTLPVFNIRFLIKGNVIAKYLYSYGVSFRGLVMITYIVIKFGFLTILSYAFASCLITIIYLREERVLLFITWIL